MVGAAPAPRAEGGVLSGRFTRSAPSWDEARQLLAYGGSTGCCCAPCTAGRRGCCGWETTLPPDPFLQDGTWEFELRALRDGEVIFTCTVGLRSRPDGSTPGLKGPYEVAGGSLYV